MSTSDHRIRVLKESEAVAKRMEKSRKEIELLKVEYERLLERGIRGPNTSNITDTDKQKEILNKRDEGGTVPVRSVTGSKVSTTNTEKVPLRKRPTQKPPESSLGPVSPKVKHYNVDDAREFIKKQRERRLSQQKQLKETDNAIELKKQKLKELHQKSLQIVARNRQRSKSREKLKTSELEVPTPTPISIAPPLNLNASTKVTTIQCKPTQNKPKADEKTNITYRIAKVDVNLNKKTNYVNLSTKSDDAKIKAATLIQAYFRGHIQRRIYQDALQLRMESRRKQQAGERARKVLEEQKLEEIRIEVAAKLREQREIEEAAQAGQVKNVPAWLQVEPNIHPYNFITSVKRKLNVALSTPVKTSDVAIQSSFSIDEKTPQRSSKEVRVLIEQNLSNKKSDKEVHEKIEKSLKAIRDLQMQQSKEGEAKRQSIVDIVDLDSKRLNNLKLKCKSDHSDSDTSKNIPDISLESQFNTYHTTSSIKSDTESVIVFKKPKEAPPKPKRMSRIDSKPLGSHGSSTISSQSVHSGQMSKSEEGSSSRSKSTAKSLAKEERKVGDFKLCINLDRLKEIKLQRRMLLEPDNTSLLAYVPEAILSNDISEDIASSKTKRSKSQISNQTSHEHGSSSINTKMSNKSKSHSQLQSQSNDVAQEEATQVSSKQNTNISKIDEDSKVSTALTHSSTADSKVASKSSNSSIAFQYSSHSKRDSIITGNVSHYTKSFESYKASQPLTPLPAAELSDTPENLTSFRQYMKEMDDSQKITHTPFQPKQQFKKRYPDAEKRLQDVINKVSQLEHQSKAESHAIRLNLEPLKLQHVQEVSGVLSNKILNEVNELNTKDQVNFEKRTELLVPDVNLVLKSSDSGIENKDPNRSLSGKTSVETVAGTSNQIHVKFEAELHLLNDFNDSLRQIMNIEKSMLDLQTKYHMQPTETRDTQTSIITPNSKSMSNSKSLNSTSSIVEKSINYSRGSDYNEQQDNRIQTSINKQMALENSIMHDNSLLITDNSLNVSDITLSNTTQHHTLQLESNRSEIDKQICKLNSAGVSLGMFDQLIRDEDVRIDNLKTVLRIREKALLDRTKSELTWLEIQKKQLLETGKLHEASLLKKKQRGIVLKLQEEKNEMQRLKQMQKAASKERKSMLKEQRNLIKAQLTSPHTCTKLKRSTKTEHRSSGPVKVYNYQSETSISRKSSISENVVYTSRSESIISKISDNEIESHKLAIVGSVTSHTDMAKRSLQMREAALQKRRKEAEDLLKWHRKLLVEERKIAELEMAASNVINQVPAADNEKYAFKSAASTIWADMTAGKHQKSISERHSHSNSKTSITSNDTAAYPMDFDDKGKESRDDVALEKGIKESESTLNEIMQNINNITDEISELYKLSSNHSKPVEDTVDARGALDGGGSIATDSSLSSKASVINTTSHNHKISVPEVSIKSDGPNDSIVVSISKSEEARTQIESFLGSKTKPSRTVSDELKSELKLIDKKGTSEKTEEDVSSIQDDVQSEEKKGLSVDGASTSSETETATGNQVVSEENTNNSGSKAIDSTLKQVQVEDSIIKSVEIETLKEETPKVEQSEVPTDGENSKELLSSETVVKESIHDEECYASERNSKESIVKSELEIVLQLLGKKVDEDVTSIKCDLAEGITKGLLPVAEVETLVDCHTDNENVSVQTDLEIKENHSDKSQSVHTDNEIDRLPSTHDQASVIKEDTVEDVSYQPSISKSEIKELSSDVHNATFSIEVASIISVEKELSELKSPLKTVETDEVDEESLPDRPNTVVESLDGNEDTLPSKSAPSQREYEDEHENTELDCERLSSNELETEIDSNRLLSIEDALPLPVIDVKLQDRRQLEECDSGSIGSSNSSSNLNEVVKDHTQSSNEDMNETFDDLESIKESPHSITEVLDEVVLEEEEEDSSGTDKKSIDVKKRVSEILADANLNASIEEKSPRLPDIYVTTYDVMSPDNSPELGSPVDNAKPFPKPKDIYGIGTEAQELLKKQLAIEQEIKQIERQQKEQLPYIFVREIPNKPPPPYTPPVQQAAVQPSSIIPSSSVQIEEITPHLAEIFYKGFVDKTLQHVTFPDLKSNSTDKLCAEFMFDICKDLAMQHYKQFEEVATLSWLKLNKRQNFRRPYVQAGLETMFNKKLNQLFGFENVAVKESMIIKWSRKKRDYVDELLVVESQAEEAEWTNYDQDELIVKDEVTNSLLDVLIGETADILQDILSKRGSFKHC